jgi:hypothetical protein
MVSNTYTRTVPGRIYPPVEWPTLQGGGGGFTYRMLAAARLIFAFCRLGSPLSQVKVLNL